MPEQTLTICMIDDDDDDAFLARRIFTKQARPVHFVHRADAGAIYDDVESLQLPLGDKQIYPDFIFLDINMPKASGFLILEKLKDHPRLQSVPVIMFTTSDLQEHIDAAYVGGAAAYVVKPLSVEHFSRFAELFLAYWDAVRRPAPLAS